MKYLEVREIGVARDDQYVANAYPGDGVYVNQLDRDPVCVLAGRVWRLPAGSHVLVREAPDSGKIEYAVKGGEKIEYAVKAGVVDPTAVVTEVKKPTPDDSDWWAPRNPVPDPLALRRWAWEQAVKVGADNIEARAEEILRWVLQVG